MKKRILSVMLTLVTAGMLVAGCGSSTTETADTGSTAGSESAAGETATGGTENTATESLIPAGEESDKLLELQKNGIRIGYCNDIPYEYIDDDGNFAGFEIEIIEIGRAHV